MAEIGANENEGEPIDVDNIIEVIDESESIFGFTQMEGLSLSNGPNQKIRHGSWLMKCPSN